MVPGEFTVSKKLNCKQRILKKYTFIGLWLDLDWIVNPFWKVDLDLDCQSYICDGFGLDWQSKKIKLSNTLIDCSTKCTYNLYWI